MLRILGKTLGSALAVLCLVSSLAVATEMTCAKDDGKGQCIAAMDPDGQTVVVVGEGLKAGEQMDCVDRGNMVACQPLVMASIPLVPFEMICTKDDGKGQCIAATDADNQTVVVVGEGVKAGEKMSCVDRGSLIACQAL
jgi:predicted ribosome-associated RNA-binding protein Tma20